MILSLLILHTIAEQRLVGMELFSNEAKQNASVTQVHPELVICRLARKLKSNRAGSDSQLIHTDTRNCVRISLLSSQL